MRPRPPFVSSFTAVRPTADTSDLPSCLRPSSRQLVQLSGCVRLSCCYPSRLRLSIWCSCPSVASVASSLSIWCSCPPRVFAFHLVQLSASVASSLSIWCSCPSVASDCPVVTRRCSCPSVVSCRYPSLPVASSCCVRPPVASSLSIWCSCPSVASVASDCPVVTRRCSCPSVVSCRYPSLPVASSCCVRPPVASSPFHLQLSVGCVRRLSCSCPSVVVRRLRPTARRVSLFHLVQLSVGCVRLSCRYRAGPPVASRFLPVVVQPESKRGAKRVGAGAQETPRKGVSSFALGTR